MITSFPTPETDNIGGCRSFQFIETEKVLSIPVSSGRIVHSAITLVQGATWKTGYAAGKSLTFSEKMQENDAGKYFITEITGFYPKMTKEAISLFSAIKLNRFIVLVTDNNGLTRVAGTLETPLDFMFDADSGGSASSRNGFSFSFKGQLISESPFYNVNIS